MQSYNFCLALCHLDIRRGSDMFCIPYPKLTLGALLNFCGKFLVFDVQSSTTEKEQTVSYPMFLKIGAPVLGAGTD